MTIMPVCRLLVIAYIPTSIAATCIKPPAEDEARRIAHSSYLPALQTEALAIDQSASLQWVRAVWEAPKSGALMAFTCSGKLLDGRPIGAIDQWSILSMPAPIGSVLRAEYIIGTGTNGALIKEIGLFSVVNERIVEVWKHDLFISRFDVCGIGHEVTSFNVDFNASVTHITVKGARTITTYRQSDCSVASKSREQLPDEEYCWDSKLAFSPCEEP